MRRYTFASFVLVILLEVFLVAAQFPPRLNIPGAVLLPQGGRPPHRPQRIQSSPDGPLPPRLRKPIPNALPISIPIREESDEENRPSILDDEVAKLTLSARPVPIDDEPEPPRPVPFRPERPLPILRQDLRESAPPPRPILRQEIDDEPPIRHPSPPVRRPPPPQQQQVRQPVRANPRPPPQQFLEDDDGRRIRNRKPPVQILRKYRTDNEDGSITWGFENEDGTFKEETIGADCIIRGKYGYVDPEGTRREYSYETGNKCDQPEEEYPLEDLPPQQVIGSRAPSGGGNFKKQYKVPLPIQP